MTYGIGMSMTITNLLEPAEHAVQWPIGAHRINLGPHCP